MKKLEALTSNMENYGLDSSSIHQQTPKGRALLHLYWLDWLIYLPVRFCVCFFWFVDICNVSLFLRALYALQGGKAPWFMCWLQRYINCLCVYWTSFLTFFLLNFFFPYAFLLSYFLTRLLPDLSAYFFQNRPVLFPSRRSYEATESGFTFLC